MNQIICMDCVEGAKNYLSDESVDLIVTDPPYNLGYGGTNVKTTRKPRFGYFENDQLTLREYYQFTRAWLQEAYRILKPGKHIYIFIDWRMYSYIYIWMQRIGFKVKNTVVWDKKHFGMGYYYRYQHEFIIFGWKGKQAHPIRTRVKNVPDIWQIPKLAGQKMRHPTEKPIELMKKIIQHSSDPEDLVVDFFAGSGVTGDASISLNRSFVGFEINKKYAEEGNERILRIHDRRHGLDMCNAMNNDQEAGDIYHRGVEKKG